MSGVGAGQQALRGGKGIEGIADFAQKRRLSEGLSPARCTLSHTMMAQRPPGQSDSALVFTPSIWSEGQQSRRRWLKCHGSRGKHLGSSILDVSEYNILDTF